jgi:predicted small lipoprotein YifL
VIRASYAFALLAIASFAVNACGQMGPLTLPDDTEENDEQQSDEENER